MNIRDTENITILRTIVHVIDKIQYQKAILSDNEIDLTTMDVEVHKFISDHIKKSVNNNESKLAKFSSPRTMVQALSNNILENPDVFFVHHSQRIAQHLYNNSPNNSTPGCLVMVLYSDTTENFLALIKLDKNDSILYERNSNGDYELVRRGSTLPAPSKRTKLLKFATLRNTNEISEDELDTRPSLIILDSQAEEFTRFFFKTFLDSEFLLTDEHKSEKLMEGLSDFLRSSVDYSLDQKSTIMDSFADKLRNNEYFNVEEAGQQILSPYLTEEFVLGELERLEYSVRHKGIGDLNLKGVMNPKIMKKYFNTVNIKTVEGLKLRYPREMNGTQVKIIPIEDSQSSNIIIEGIHIIEGK